MKKYFMPFLVVIFVLTSGALVGCGQPAYFKAPGEPVHLVNNSRAYDRTWREVQEFLSWDSTDKEAYTLERTGGYFAEGLHNRAEYYGIKAALAVVEFETGEPYALNAFKTIDYGLVYVDCTGEGGLEAALEAESIELAPPPYWGGLRFLELAPVDHWDKVAYVVEGEKMGFISLGYDKQTFSYSWYQKYKARFEDFKKALAAYGEEVDEFKSQPQPDTPEPMRPGETWDEFLKRSEGMNTYEVERNKLREKGYSLQAEWEEVSGYNWEESDSPVTLIRIHW
ncbi:hypothetical protein ACFLT0_00520 [Chloroflexota bacterium]